jgi:hypothetical protein
VQQLGGHTVKCFTCPRERRGEEPGWHFVDIRQGAHAYGPPRIFVCPRHYRDFAERERDRWTRLDPPAPSLDFVDSLASES